jgi:hypothetical protein
MRVFEPDKGKEILEELTSQEVASILLKLIPTVRQKA